MIVAIVLTLDLITKSILVNSDESLWQNYVLIDGVLVLMPSKNFGAGFSLLSGKTWLLISLTIIFVVLFSAFNFMYQKKSKLYGVASALILTGAIGNLIDRLAFGYVRDFIYLQFINFPIFNVADISLTFGVILLVIYILFYSSKSKDKHAEVVNNLGTELDNKQDNTLNQTKQEYDKITENIKNDTKQDIIDNGVNDAKDSDK